MRSLLIGCGAGFSGDRIDAAQAVVRTLIARGQPAVLIFEMLAERTLALGQLAKNQNPELGYEPLLQDVLAPILVDCVAHHIPIVSNFGAANPVGAAKAIQALALEQNLAGLKIAVVEGDDILEKVDISNLQIWEGDRELAAGAGAPIAANVYLGANAISQALADGAHIVITGRVADPALTVGPAMAHFNWDWQDWDQLAAATLAGHLLECGSQVTGGYFADPGYKDVPDVANVGFPIAELFEDGRIIIGKADSTGGTVNLMTVKEQMLYEIHDPACYVTPDVILDISQVLVRQIGPDQVVVTGARGAPRPDTLKATVSFMGDWFGEGEISYAGPNAGARARLAADILGERAKLLDEPCRFRRDLLGVVSVLDSDTAVLRDSLPLEQVTDVRLRLAVNAPARATVERLLHEVNALYCCGPAGGGGVRTSVKSSVRTVSYLVPRELVQEGWRYVVGASS
ncbi:hypothetical protein CAP48_06275 [Advenella sp. S44]|uniref:acyclic terpene utilization AtuA family protein n=1 Tax=Advenella sp. S44 TaxID=1982755 RepID=UPI000C2ADC22|nr:acyclic terpene utilization AtuA family protein [Advenella sp. S44]PJX25646.1 hypothetical protein CAP48_06275 [Advenella sp. S44]